jgi:hypothetical protein
MNDLTRYPDPDVYTIPADWVWWDCPECGDYAWLDPNDKEPKCSCDKVE